MSDRLRVSLRRVVIVYIVAFGLLATASGAALYIVARHGLARQLDRNIENRMAFLTRAYDRGGLPGLRHVIDELSRRGARTFGYRLADRRGTVLEAVAGVPALPPGWGYVRFPDLDEDAVDPARTLTRRLPDGSTLTILADRDFVEQFDEATISFAICVVALLLALAAAGGFTLERHVRWRLRRLNETARAIFEGKLDSRVPVSDAHDEFDAVAMTVNTILDRLTTLLEEGRRVSGYIAHDLRAPLVRLRDQLEKTDSECTDVASCHRGLQQAMELSDQAIRLFGAMLQIGEVDASLVAEVATRIDLSALVADLVEAHVPVAEDSGHRLVSEIAPGIHVTGDRELLGQAIVNLIDNGLRHTPPGSRIWVGLSRSNGLACLSVGDNGPSMTDAERQSLLAGGRRSSGDDPDRAALGLKLVVAIVTAHRGSIRLIDNDPGLCFQIELPLDRERSAEG